MFVSPGPFPERPPVRGERGERFGVHRGQVGGIEPERLQRALLAADTRLDQLDQRLAVVGQQQELVGEPNGHAVARQLVENDDLIAVHAGQSVR